MNRIKNIIKDNLILVIFAVFMGVIYIYGMYTNKPWYDELYTYYSFISRGPIYAAIHWPVPNNHIGYSVISAFFDIVFDSYIGLRGVSVIASVVNIILVYAFAYRVMGKKAYGCLAAIAFAGNYLVNSLAIQGRGYALTTMCFLVAVNMLVKIILKDWEKSNKKSARIMPYIIFALSLTLGLYTIPSSLYWVMPVCFFGGFVLMMQKRYKEMRQLIYFSIFAAVMTFGLYTLVWLAIGSNLLSKDPSSAWFNVYQVNIILHAPFTSFKTGMDYMLATPYIQSTDRSIVVTGLWRYLGDLFNLYVGGIGYLITVVLVVVAVLAAVRVIKIRVDREKNAAEYSAAIFLIMNIVMMPLMLMIQSVQPYKRVFSYFGAVWAVALVYVISIIISVIKEEKTANLVFGCLAVVIAAGVLIQTYRCEVPLADRENDIASVLTQCEEEGLNPRDIGSMYYTDDFQKYVLKFYYDTEPAETTLEETEFVFVSSDLLSSEGSRDWPMLTTFDDFKIDYVVDNFDEISRNDKYIVYRRK